ncbi:hypothetical protein COOONC_14787 [Cooperia oncophora]
MSLYFYKKSILASAIALSSLLKKYDYYGENLEYPENEEELLEKAIANVTLITSALIRVRTAVESIQEKVDKMESQVRRSPIKKSSSCLIDFNNISSPCHSSVNRPRGNFADDVVPNNYSENQSLITCSNVDSAELTRNEQIVLMTAEGNLYKHRSKRYEKVFFFFDTGAQKTVIQEGLAVRLSLPKISTDTCTMSGIGGHSETFDSHLVPLKCIGPNISEGFRSALVTRCDQGFLEREELFLANSNLRGERQVPHILVGLDRYYDLVTTNMASICTPSGLHIAKTVFGPTLYGRGVLLPTDTHKAEENRNQAVSYYDDDIRKQCSTK